MRVVRLRFFGPLNCHFSRAAIRVERAKTGMEFFGPPICHFRGGLPTNGVDFVLRLRFFGPSNCHFSRGATRVERAKTGMQFFGPRSAIFQGVLPTIGMVRGKGCPQDLLEVGMCSVAGIVLVLR